MKRSDNASERYHLYTFGKVNLYILLGSLAVIVVGYLLMAGGKSADGVSFNPEVFSTRRITVAPIVTTLGYLGLLVAILYRPRHHKVNDTEELPSSQK